MDGVLSLEEKWHFLNYLLQEMWRDMSGSLKENVQYRVFLWRKLYRKFALYYTIMMQQTSLFYQCTIHHRFTHYAVPLCKLTITAVDISEKERSGQFAPKYVLLTASLGLCLVSNKSSGFAVCSKHLAGDIFTHPMSKLLATTMSCFKHPNCSFTTYVIGRTPRPVCSVPTKPSGFAKCLSIFWCFH